MARASWTPTRTRHANPERKSVDNNGSDTTRSVRAESATDDAMPSSRRSSRRQGPAQPVSLATTPLRDVHENANHNNTTHSAVRQVDHTSELSVMPALPSVEAYPAAAPMQGGYPVPMQGQVLATPIIGSDVVIASDHGGTACDALPGGCGCGDSVCGGSCGFEPVCGVGTPIVGVVEPGCGAGGLFGTGLLTGGGCGVGSACDGGCDALGGNGCCSMCGELASPQAWRPCVTLCVPQDGWVSFEYLAWWQDGMSLPPLVTTSTDPGVARNQAGVLGAGPTRVLFGGNDVLDDAFDGGRLRFGVWLDRCHTWGIGAEYFQLGSETDSFSATSSGNPILARPFVNILNGGVEDSELVAFPGVISGNVGVRATSQLVGGGFSIRRLQSCNEGCSGGLFCGCAEHVCSRSELLVGYRYLELEEGVTITENLVATDGSNGRFDLFDSYETRNQFNGFDLGWMYRRTRGFWTLDSTIRLGIGNTRQRVRINGQTTITDPATTPTVQTLPGGLLAQRSNIGTYERDEFTVVPEWSLGLGYQLTDHLRATLGYNFIYWSNVVRPGQHISRDLNPNLLPPEADPLTGGLRPQFAFDSTDYWVQGISVGGEFRW
ncbi:MAG: BBP7 family outer membrane beta-barrel protein [Planctomycetota bacterium]